MRHLIRRRVQSSLPTYLGGRAQKPTVPAGQPPSVAVQAKRMGSKRPQYAPSPNRGKQSASEQQPHAWPMPHRVYPLTVVWQKPWAPLSVQ